MTPARRRKPHTKYDTSAGGSSSPGTEAGDIRIVPESSVAVRDGGEC